MGPKTSFKSDKINHPSLYDSCIDIISDFQVSKAQLDPANIFPSVATKRFLNTLQSSTCRVSGEGFEEGNDIYWRYCGQHILHCNCLKAHLSSSSTQTRRQNKKLRLEGFASDESKFYKRMGDIPRPIRTSKAKENSGKSADIQFFPESQQVLKDKIICAYTFLM